MPAPTQSRGHFRLTRYFSGVSLGLMALVGVALTYFAQTLTLHELKFMAERRNEAMTAVFLNVLWPDFAPLVASSSSADAAALRRQAEQVGLHAKTAALMRNSEIIKVKLYNLQGLTVYSSDPKQIGEDKRTNPGFVSASQGLPQSELTHRNSFDAFEGQRTELDVISSYLPVRDKGKVLGVIELYQDVTGFVLRREQLLMRMGTTSLAAMLALYGLQLLLVQRAQRILQAQEADLQAANRDLDQRVHSRTEELSLAKARLEHLAHHDPLTGLPNRLLFKDHLRRKLSQAQRSQTQLALLFIDLDRFKEVNDSLGHLVGDALLVCVADRLLAVLRGGDLLARLGGDEFVCVLSCEDANLDAPQVAQKLLDTVVQAMQLQGHEIQLSASVGISIFPGDGLSVDELAGAADAAMYEAKRAGRNRFHFYRPEMTQSAQARAHMERLLRRSLAAGEMQLYFQMKLEPESSAPDDGRRRLRPSGAEALARWHNAELGQVPPGRFIALAEESGFINELGAWVLRQACLQMSAWAKQGLRVPHISVNLSVRQLERSDIVEVVRQALLEADLPAAALELEITESVIMNADNALPALAALHQLGVRLSVDDFGTGYSSLAYLKLLPIQTLKIDRSFVTGIGEQLSDESIIQAVIGLARSLGLSTVAEGVETEAQLDFLLAQGCDQVQGFLFSRPLPAEAFTAEWMKLQDTEASKA
ncbi:MAG: EAL domain-containing protein [Paucibacter sp.]|nr:EAL domain-containing protein [Roseateles sp.]